MTGRPIDVLNAAKGKNVMIKLKNRTQVSGILKAFDMHINVWVEDAQVTDEEGEAKKLGDTLLRGDSIIYISPAQ
ncbi:MAG: hypothetical protein KAJ88_03580 [Candidatus Aenigmarchaeota archaeon]|nr:hypothetical protein [Candidatus Aenigmarchaeota archaeon]